MAKLQKPKPKIRIQLIDGRDLRAGCLFTRNGVEHEVEAITEVRQLTGRVDLVTTKGVPMTFTAHTPHVGLVQFVYSKPIPPQSEGATATHNEGNTMAKTATTKGKKLPPPPAKKTSAKAPASAVAKDTKNGITRPSPDTTSGKVFAFADKMKERAPVLEAAEKAGINQATAATQFSKWRIYNCITGRTPKPVKQTKKPTKAPTKPTPPPPPAAE